MNTKTLSTLALTIVLFLSASAQAWTVVPVPGTFTAQWTDSNGVAHSSPANSSGEVYVGNAGRYVMHNVAYYMDDLAARNGSPSFYACYSALEVCLSVTGQVDAQSVVQGSGQNDVFDYNLATPTASATLNLTYALKQTFANAVSISAATALTVYPYPTDTDLNHIFAYAKSLSVFAGAGSVQTGTIPQGQTGAGTYKFIVSGDGQWAAGINTDDGKLWLYHSGNFQAFDNYWVYLKDAQSKGF